MPEKPRVKAPTKRATVDPEASARKRRILFILGGVGIALIAVLALAGLLGFRGGGPDEESVRKDLVAAGCTLQAVEAQRGVHSLTADGTAKWNTDPPTSGPHFGFDQNQTQGTAIWGAYTEPVQLARVIHNLEHGGVYIFYGDEVSESVVEQLRAFYDEHQRGTILAPYPKLGDKIALGAWVAEGDEAKGYLAKCKAVDGGAFSAFFSAFQFKGPERFPASSLLPGGS